MVSPTGCGHGCRNAGSIDKLVSGRPAALPAGRIDCQSSPRRARRPPSAVLAQAVLELPVRLVQSPDAVVPAKFLAGEVLNVTGLPWPKSLYANAGVARTMPIAADTTASRGNPKNPFTAKLQLREATTPGTADSDGFLRLRRIADGRADAQRFTWRTSSARSPAACASRSPRYHSKCVCNLGVFGDPRRKRKLERTPPKWERVSCC